MTDSRSLLVLLQLLYVEIAGGDRDAFDLDAELLFESGEDVVDTGVASFFANLYDHALTNALSISADVLLGRNSECVRHND